MLFVFNRYVILKKYHKNNSKKKNIYFFCHIIIKELKYKGDKYMGITAKPVLKTQSIMRKMENQLEAERKAAKKKAKKDKK